MSDEKSGVGRREALWWLLGTPIHLGVLSEAAAAQLTPPRNLRIRQATLPADSPIARNLHPRTFLTPTILTSLRSQLARDAAFRARWQTAINQFEASGGTWATTGAQKDAKRIDAYATAFAAFLACVRRPDNDLGLTWKDSWQTYRNRVVTAANGWHHDGKSYPPHAVAIPLIYDWLYHDLTVLERADLVSWITPCADNGHWVIDTHCWDNHETDNHVARLLSSLVLDDASARFPTAYAKTVDDWAESCNWMAYATGVGYEWKGGFPSRVGLCASLFALKNAGGLTDAETMDRMLLHLRDAWQSIRQFVIPHPSSAVAPGDYWFNDRVNMTEPTNIYHRGLNVGGHMLWAMAILPGKVQLDGASGYSDQATLAKSEADYFGYLQHVWDSSVPMMPKRMLRNVTDFTHIGTFSPSSERSGVQGFYAFPAWLILNTREHAPVDPVTAGIPKVRRWWPGTLDWTTILSGFSHTEASLITYHHRKWWMSGYEEGCRQNGSWHVHRDGPLLIQRGSASHGSLSRKATWAANGTVSFVDHSLYPVFTRPNQDNDEAGNIRLAGGSRKSKAAILAEADLMDYGDVTGWYADDHVVAITSNLVRSYNSSVVQFGKLPANEPKISAFTREFVCVRRGGDGTDHERVFTYDRITVLDPKFEPRYNLCPATNPHIDGVERPHEPWAPSGADWTAVGPTRWDYSGATRMIYDNTIEPRAPRPGNGKVCVTWLRPSGAAVRVQKLGGTNVRSAKEPKANGAPGINPWNGWVGLDGEWDRVDTLETRAYTGLYTVAVMPAQVTLDTRFLLACDVMAATDQPSAAMELTCDANSVAARCGASAVVFSRDAGGHRAGSVVIPNGVVLIVLANLPQGETRQLAASGGLTISTANRTARSGSTSSAELNAHGRLVVGVRGTGTLSFS